MTKEKELVTVLDLTSDPFATLISAAQDAGLDPAVMARMLDRVKSKYQPVLGEMRTVKTQGILAKIEDRLDRALDYLDDLALAGASAKDLAIIVGILAEKRQLLRGEPTHIMSSTERMSVNELVPALLREAEKRGLTVQNDDKMIDITPASTERATRPRGKMSLADRRKLKKLKEKFTLGEPS